jgi:hypothetical protein
VAKTSTKVAKKVAANARGKEIMMSTLTVPRAAFACRSDQGSPYQLVAR